MGEIDMGWDEVHRLAEFLEKQTNYDAAELVRGLRAALDAAEARAVGVRELVWDNCSDSRYRGGFNPSEWISRGSALSYTIQRLTGAKMRRVGLEGKFRLNVRGFHMFGPDHDTLELAQAAAQADYTARILSALHPASPLGAVVMREMAAEVCEIERATSRNASLQLARNAIRALPLPTDAELLAAAAELPEVKSLVEAVKETAAILQAAVVSGKVRGGDSYRIGGVYLQTVADALDAANLSLDQFIALETP